MAIWHIRCTDHFFMKLAAPLKSLILMSRPANLLMSIAAVALGFWLSSSPLGLINLILLMVAAACSVSFGNIVNDIRDIETDRISHPDRPLVKGDISRTTAIVFSMLFAAIGLICAFSVSWIHGIGTIIPLCFLLLYALRLKSTPLIGNFIVSLLVAYPLLFGALGSDNLSRLYIPVLLAFLLNLCREIVKDVQDIKGDTKAGLTTSAALSPLIIQLILALSSLV
jgi:geranylgeranylglycerol-phosphate geranylgeranyltransferase